jgi:FAD/FMN-containing dehydrogenase
MTITDSSAISHQVSEDAVAEIRAALRGTVITPGEPEFDELRRVWNHMIDRRPALIARCAGRADVMQCVQFAGTRGLPVSIRGGGHNVAGSAVIDGGLMIDLSEMRSVRVDADSRRVVVEPGARLSDVDHESQAFGLAVPLGVTSTTGVAGLALGGGVGWLTRKHGMTVDNLVSAGIVLADGRFVRADKQNEPELFWALRGGGGNFGVVTEFEFQLHPVGPEVFAGLIVFPLESGGELLWQYREYARTLPDEMSVWVVMRHAPPLPFLPDEVHGKPVVAFAFMFAGDAETGTRLVEPVRGFGTAHGEFSGPMPFVAWQQSFDALLTPPARNYWKSHNLVELPDAAIDTLVAAAAGLPSEESQVVIGLVGGQANRVSPDATAYAHRDAQYIAELHARWQDKADDAAAIAWTRETFDAITPHATGGVYVNFMSGDEQDRIREAYGSNYERLVAAKRSYDPDNFFRANQNIIP